jgi:vacuolar-type H+-ATPase subunit E/Vma4
MNIEQREQGLLKLVDDYREQECRRLLDEARTQARELRRQAYARERAALHQRVTAERARAQGLIQAAEAELATRERRRVEQTDAALVDAAWPRLVDALKARWNNTETRRAWVGHALGEALRRLERGDWLVRHAPGLPEAEQGEAEERARREAEISLRFGVDDGVVAGLIINAKGAVLDMSLNGLLRDRAPVEARLLALARAERRL